MDSPVYERDIILPFKPIGLKVGDYIDLRVTLPGGEELRALTHKRIYMIMDLSLIHIQMCIRDRMQGSPFLKRAFVTKDKGTICIFKEHVVSHIPVYETNEYAGSRDVYKRQR